MCQNQLSLFLPIVFVFVLYGWVKLHEIAFKLPFVVLWTWSSKDDLKTSLNQHQSFSGEILPHFDINNLSVPQKLKKLGIGPFHLEI